MRQQRRAGSFGASVLRSGRIFQEPAQFEKLDVRSIDEESPALTSTVVFLIRAITALAAARLCRQVDVGERDRRRTGDYEDPFASRGTQFSISFRARTA